LEAAELYKNTHILVVLPMAKLPIATPDKIMNIKRGTRRAQTLLSIHSLVTTMRDVKPKSMLEVKSRVFESSKGTTVSIETCLMMRASKNGVRIAKGKAMHKTNAQTRRIPFNLLLSLKESTTHAEAYD